MKGKFVMGSAPDDIEKVTAEGWAVYDVRPAKPGEEIETVGGTVAKAAPEATVTVGNKQVPQVVVTDQNGVAWFALETEAQAAYKPLSD